ncbi:KPN_02809 family neutral zinc metallopeptidase [Alteraurantiacibacter aquimixticola]|uniref:Zinc metalloprotease n=1 Tax=Alteraurantiacibacter aquimixticola TaxID=2489173 RepID=A0A4V4U8J7_9SPHN|nr:neutral zinc metallopeptidase [Alteraurantiacibacter aquimixticola]TIX50233.1 zinc metalloprotease [Alteraurantiacibacter aquimixticola]
MRLNPFNPNSIRVTRGSSGGRMGGARGIGCGGIVVVLIGALVFGVDPGQMIGMVEGVQQTTGSQQQGQVASNESAMEICDDNQYSMESCNALGSLDETWRPLFAEAGIRFEQPTLRFLDGGTVSTGCGQASSAMGPFYCPADETINIDVAFYDQMARQMGAGGDFARYYVMAHEYGHHIQHLTGLAEQVRSAQSANPRSANQLQVRMELQADCYAGVWAARNRNLIEPGDLEEGMQAANAIGDDTLMRNAGRRVNQESFTHGSSAQRMEWLRRGLQTGDEDQCDTFADLRS